MTTKPFRWSSINSDLALAREVSNCRPQKPVDWEDVAHRLSSYFGSDEKPVKLTGRGCRERIDRILSKYKEEDNRSLKRYSIYCIL